MDQTLRGHISNCLARAAEAGREAERTADPQAKEEYLALELSWIRLAESYQFSERLERFLLEQVEGGWQPILSAPFNCDVEVAVTDDRGLRALPFPCRRVVGGWIDVRTSARIDKIPTRWRALKKPP